ncbi:MAG: biotin carboxylase N-terminal domain-containing protein, partial [Myxococcota bacterium]|nr:biotin carboxylase N-terminal domain-containing protein [Myxococcota bacterium]
MFETVLIANRGAIACRIAEVLRSRGIRSVAVYSEADADMPHRHAADEAVCIGPAPARESYLDGARIIATALECGADAIHPGYGFLAENAGFARACAQAGVVFIGPSPEVIEAMGDKAAARQAAVAAGVPVVPGSPGPLHDPAEAARVAERVGYPVVVKAAAGGGGIGMVKVKKPEKLDKALGRAGELAARSFGDDTVYIERYLEGARHVEVQLLCDREGHGVHLFERECSIQRRHQKVIEEAPSPFVASRPELRARLVEAALRLAREIRYENAGTVEFLVTPGGELFFIEMNTRLQVEHAVTVAVTGVDIIGWQLDIAAGEPLTLAQSDVELRGAAVECRLYAEDPLR